MGRRVIVALLTVAMATTGFSVLGTASAQAATNCNVHCYSVLDKNDLSPAATMGSLSLNSKCLSESGSQVGVDGLHSSHTNNEIWAAVNSTNYVEFGHTINYGDASATPGFRPATGSGSGQIAGHTRSSR